MDSGPYPIVIGTVFVCFTPFRKNPSCVPMNAMMNEKGRQTKLLAAIAVLAMVVCALAMVMPSGQVDATDATTNEAQIGDTAYATFEAAVEAAVDGDTIEILADVTVEAPVDITGKTVTIELNNHTIHSTSTTSGYVIRAMTGSDVTINGQGTITNTFVDESKAHGAIRAEKSILTLNGVTVVGKQYGVGAFGTTDDGRTNTITDSTEFITKVYLNECDITSSYGAFGISGSYGLEYIEITDTTLKSNDGVVVYLPSNAKVIISGSTITGESGIDQRAGYLEITNSTINYTGAGEEKAAGDGPTNFGVGIIVLDSNYSEGDVTTIVDNVTFNGGKDSNGEIYTGVQRDNNGTTSVDNISDSTNPFSASHNSLVSIDGFEFSSKKDASITPTFMDDGNVTVGQASKATITENYTLGSGKTFTVNNGGTVEVAPNTTVNMTGGKVIATESWNLTVGAGADANLPKVTDSAGTMEKSPTITAVGDAAITINGTKPTYTAQESANNITDQSDLQDAIDLGYPSIELDKDVAINSDLVIDYPVDITTTGEGKLTIGKDVSVTFTGGSYVGKVSGNGDTATVDLKGSFTLKAGSIIVIDLSSNEKNSITVDNGTTVVLQGALNADLTVTMKGTGSAVFSAFSTCSICTFIPPVFMVLSLRPRMRNRPRSSNSAMSFVTSRSGFTDGASMASVPSGVRLRRTFANGVYHSEASFPLSFRRAICDKVSVIP